MVLLSEIIEKIEKFAPVEIAQEWDNVGLIVGRRDKNVSKVLLALDIDINVAKEAKEIGADAIITHHPLIFSPINKINSDTPIGKCVLFLAQNDISLYSAHTNLDAAHGGLNDYLSSLYELEDTEPILDVKEYDGEFYGLGRVGTLNQEMTLVQLAKYISEKIGSKNVKFIGDSDAKISRVALCSGGGGSMVCSEIAQKADVYITGDVKYSNARNAIDMGLNVICVEHYDSEIFCMNIFENILKDLDICVVKSSANVNVVNSLM